MAVDRHCGHQYAELLGQHHGAADHLQLSPSGLQRRERNLYRADVECEGRCRGLRLQVGCAENAFYCVMEVADEMGRGQDIDPHTYTPRNLRSELHLHGRLPAAVIALGWWWQARQTDKVAALAGENLALAPQAAANATLALMWLTPI